MDHQQRQTPKTVEFTYDWYRSFLGRLETAGFDFKTFQDRVGPGDVLLRHDVDLSIEKALTTARIEAKQDIQATYCVLLTSSLYNPLEGKRRDQLRAIEALGHDVALHFSTHEYWDMNAPPDDAVLEAQVDEERDMLGNLLATSPETVSFHVPPEWVLNRSFEGFTNAYGPDCFSDVNYLADSGQRWRQGFPSLPETDEPVQITTHPGLWGEWDLGFEERIDEAVTSTCDHASTTADREFIEEVYAK